MKAILFDLDHTLVDRAGAHQRYWKKFLAQRAGAFAERQGRGEDLLAALVAEDHSGLRERDDYCAWAAAFLPEAGLNAAELWADYRDGLVDFVKPDPAMRRVVETLAATHALAVVSNGSGPRQRAKLARSGLADLFAPDAVFISGETGWGKPDSRLFLAALRRVSCLPREATFVGDDPARDIVPAAALGMRTCWVSAGRTYPVGLPMPDRTIVSVAELG